MWGKVVKKVTINQTPDLKLYEQSCIGDLEFSIKASLDALVLYQPSDAVGKAYKLQGLWPASCSKLVRS